VRWEKKRGWGVGEGAVVFHIEEQVIQKESALQKQRER
jgi:hypothetical protein